MTTCTCTCTSGELSVALAMVCVSMLQFCSQLTRIRSIIHHWKVCTRASRVSKQIVIETVINESPNTVVAFIHTNCVRTVDKFIGRRDSTHSLVTGFILYVADTCEALDCTEKRNCVYIYMHLVQIIIIMDCWNYIIIMPGETGCNMPCAY